MRLIKFKRIRYTFFQRNTMYIDKSLTLQQMKLEIKNNKKYNNGTIVFIMLLIYFKKSLNYSN